MRPFVPAPSPMTALASHAFLDLLCFLSRENRSMARHTDILSDQNAFEINPSLFCIGRQIVTSHHIVNCVFVFINHLGVFGAMTIVFPNATADRPNRLKR